MGFGFCSCFLSFSVSSILVSFDEAGAGRQMIAAMICWSEVSHSRNLVAVCLFRGTVKILHSKKYSGPQ